MHPIVAKGRALMQAAQNRFGGSGNVIAGDARQNPIKTVAAYMQSNMSPILANWMPSLRDTQEDVRASWVLATARATDTIQNSGWIAGGIRSAIGNIVGSGLRLVAKPDTTLVKFEGLTDDAGKPIDAEGWARFVERRWQAYSTNPRECDALGRQTIAQMTISALKTWFATGEIVATLPFRKDAYSINGTKVLLQAPHRLSQKTNMLNRTVQGVQMDQYGRPYAYHFTVKGADGMTREVAVLAFDAYGRQQVIHCYEALPGQVRGITCMVPALQVVRQHDQLQNATLTAALIQSIFAATVEADAPTAEIMNALSSAEDQGIGGNLDSFLAARMGWHTQTTIDLSGQSKIAHLFPGEKLKFNRSEHPNSTYEAFIKILLREIAKCLGVTVEQLTGDYSGVTYTGVRMSTTDNWQITLDRRNNLVARFLQPIYEAWLEEEIESGRIKFPGGFQNFIALRSAGCRADWRGPPKPQADDLKTAKTHQVYREMGVMSDGDIADELGRSIEDVYEQRKREKEMRNKLGLEDMGPTMQGEAARIAREPDDDDAPDTPPPTEREAA